MAAAKEAKQKNPYLHFIIAVIITALLWIFLKPTNGLTEIGVRTVAVTVGTLYLWLTVNTHWTSIFFMGLLVMVGAMKPNEVWAGSMGHFSVISMIVFMILNYALQQTGVIDLVCQWFITRKIVKGRPYVFLAMFFASMLVLGMFMDNLSLAVIYVGIARVLAEKLGVEKGNSFYTCMFIGVIWIDIVISIASPIAHAPCLILMGLMEAQLGIAVSYAQWFAAGVPFAIVMFLVIMLVVNIWKPDKSVYDSYDADEERKNMPTLSKQGKISLVVFIVMLFLIIVPELLKNSGGFWAYFSGIGTIVIGILAVTVLCVIHIDRKPVLNMPDALKTLPMGAIIFAGVVCVMSTPITSELTGINVWMSTVLQSVFSGMSPILVTIILSVVALIMTNFLSNVVTMTLFFQIGVALMSGGDMNMGAFSLIIGFVAAMACLTPAACAPMPLIFGPGHVTMGNTLRPNIIFLVLALIVSLGIGFFYVPMILG